MPERRETAWSLHLAQGLEVEAQGLVVESLGTAHSAPLGVSLPLWGRGACSHCIRNERLPLCGAGMERRRLVTGGELQTQVLQPPHIPPKLHPRCHRRRRGEENGSEPTEHRHLNVVTHPAREPREPTPKS